VSALSANDGICHDLMIQGFFCLDGRPNRAESAWEGNQKFSFDISSFISGAATLSTWTTATPPPPHTSITMLRFYENTYPNSRLAPRSTYFMTRPGKAFLFRFLLLDTPIRSTYPPPSPRKYNKRTRLVFMERKGHRLGFILFFHIWLTEGGTARLSVWIWVDGGLLSLLPFLFLTLQL